MFYEPSGMRIKTIGWDNMLITNIGLVFNGNLVNKLKSIVGKPGFNDQCK